MLSEITCFLSLPSSSWKGSLPKLSFASDSDDDDFLHDDGCEEDAARDASDKKLCFSENVTAKDETVARDGKKKKKSRLRLSRNLIRGHEPVTPTQSAAL